MLIFMDAKAKINLIEGIVELEGSEEFVKKYLDEFKQMLKMSPIQTQTLQSQKYIPNTKNNFYTKKKEGSKSQNKSFIKMPEPIEFDIKKNGNEKPSLIEFIGQKNPQSHKEIITCIAFYLKRYLNISEFDEGHISYAYLVIKRKRPEAFHQAFIDTKNTTRWIMSGEGATKWSLYSIGEDYVEHDLPRVQDVKQSQNPIRE
jgi:hypothetical protein